MIGTPFVQPAMEALNGMEAQACETESYMIKATHQLYSRRCHITAAELRRLGFYLQEVIPDEAFVRRVAVGLDPAEPFDDGSPTNRLLLLEPFIVPQEALVGAV